MSEMSFEDAAAALGDAIDVDNGSTPSPTVPAPEQAPTAPATPEGQTAPEQPSVPRDEFGRFAPRQPEPGVPAADSTPDLFEGEPVNPDLLPEELQPLAKQLQAAFTRKTQALAEQAKQFEGIDPGQARDALELYTALQDPSYLVQFHSELSEALQARGLTPAQAEAEAARQMETATGQQSGAVSDKLSVLKDDPELAPVHDAFSQLKEELDAMKAERNAEREAQEMAQMQMALAGELMRQEAALMEQGFKERDIDRVHELAAFHDGNLLQAAESYKAMRQEMLEEYLSSKQAVESGVTPVPGDGATSEVPTTPQDLDEALRAALTHVDAAGIDTVL